MTYTDFLNSFSSVFSFFLNSFQSLLNYFMTNYIFITVLGMIFFPSLIYFIVDNFIFRFRDVNVENKLDKKKNEL